MTVGPDDGCSKGGGAEGKQRLGCFRVSSEEGREDGKPLNNYGDYWKRISYAMEIMKQLSLKRG